MKPMCNQCGAQMRHAVGVDNHPLYRCPGCDREIPNETGAFFLTAPDVLPKSFNRIGASGNWRAWAHAKKAWEAEIVKLIDDAELPRESGLFVKSTAILTVPTRRRRDAGNFGVILEKALGDALQVAGIIPDDTPEYWSWTSVTFTHTPGQKATTFVLELVDPWAHAVAA